MPEYTQVQVEPNANTPMSAQQVYKNLNQPFRVAAVRIFEGEPAGKLYAVTGWSSDAGGSACAVYGVRVEDSSAGSAYVVFGGDWGVRLRPVESTQPWSADDPGQFGETHLVLADSEDLIAAD